MMSSGVIRAPVSVVRRLRIDDVGCLPERAGYPVSQPQLPKLLHLLEEQLAQRRQVKHSSGGGRDFMRPISQEVYGVPRDRVRLSSLLVVLPTSWRGAGRRFFDPGGRPGPGLPGFGAPAGQPMVARMF
jgi:hypothetical protein